MENPHELPDVQAGFRKGRGTRDQIANIHWIIERATEHQKSIYFSFTDYAKAFYGVDSNKLWEILQFSRSVVSDSLRPHGLQHLKPPNHCQLPELTQTHVH